MDRATVERRPAISAGIATVGIDVGGERKGFHAVALSDGRYSGSISTRCVTELVDWCRDTVNASVIAVDAPCRWSKDGRARLAERCLMKKRIWCFSTPTRNMAESHRTNHYGWMLRGAELYQALEQDFALCKGLPMEGQRFCFETYPHAITWHLRDRRADASKKRTERQAVLEKASIDLTELTNIDFIDAALCALTAYHAAMGKECVSYGESDTGLIIVPAIHRS